MATVMGIYAVIWTCQVTMGKTEIVQDRLGYGTAFRPEGKLAINTEVWRHTFTLEMPRVEAKMLPPFDCKVANMKWDATCKSHNNLIHQLNGLVARLADLVETTFQTARRMIGTETDLKWRQNPDQKSSRSKRESGSRSKRGIFDFVSDVTQGLFGIAKDSDIKAMNRHLKVIAKYQAKQKEERKEDLKLLNSFMNKTNERMNGLATMVDGNYKSLYDMHVEFVKSNKRTAELAIDVSHFLPALINKTGIFAQLQGEMHNFIMGLHLLIRRRLPPSLIDRDTLLQALRTANKALKKSHANFQVIYNHPAYYYDMRDVLFAFSGRSFFVTIQIPISARNSLFNLYRVMNFPVPFNQTTTHATQIMGLPHFLAITTDNKYFVELSTEDMLQCTGSPIKTCMAAQAQRSVVKASCAVALYKHYDPKPLCNFEVIEDGIKPSLYEIEPGLAIASGIKEIVLTCPHGVVKKPGCNFCTVRLPCKCGMVARGNDDVTEFELAPRLDACESKTSMSKSFAVNMALLTQFFNESELTHLSSSANRDLPLEFQIPPLHIQNDQYRSWTNEDQTMRRGLQEVANSMKNRQAVSRLPEMNFGNGGCDPGAWPQFFGYTAAMGMLLLAFIVYRMSRQIKILAAALALLSGQTGTAAQTANSGGQATQGRNLRFAHPTDVTTTPTIHYVIMPQPTQNAIIAGLALMIMLTVIIAVMAGNKLLNKRSPGTAVYLEVGDGNLTIDLHLTTLPKTPFEYTRELITWIKGIAVTQEGWGGAIVTIVWEDFLLVDLTADQLVPLPKSARIGCFQRWRLNKILNSKRENQLFNGYYVQPKLVHKGVAVLIGKGAEPIYAQPWGMSTAV